MAVVSPNSLALIHLLWRQRFSIMDIHRITGHAAETVAKYVPAADSGPPELWHHEYGSVWLAQPSRVVRMMTHAWRANGATVQDVISACGSAEHHGTPRRAG